MATNHNFRVKNGLEVGTGTIESDGTNVTLSRDGSTSNRIRITNGIVHADTDLSVTGDLAVSGNFNITGDINQTSVTTLDVTDLTITVANNAGSSANANNAGLIVDTGGSNPSLLYKSSGDKFSFNKALEVNSRIETNTLNNIGNTANIIYRDSTNTIVGNNASALVVQDGGNVGIGTASPAAKLDVVGGHLRLDAGMSLQWSDSFERIEQSDGHLEFFVNNGEAMTLDTNGLGIGTTVPIAKLTLPLEEANAFKIAFRAASGTGHAGISTVDQSGAGLFIGANAYVNASGSIIYGRSDHPSSGIYFDGWNGDAMRFYTGASGSPAERMRINSAGDVKVGALAVASATTAPLIVAKASTDVQAIFGDNNASIDDPSIRIIGRNTANNAIRYTFLGLDADTNHGYLGYNAGAGGFVNALNFDTSGNVGIGTTAPDAKLSVTSTTINSEDILYLKSGADNVNDYLGIAWELGAGGNGPHSAIRSFAGPSGSDARLGFLTTSNGGTTLTEGLSIAHDGNVGIGTASPGELLSLYKSSGNTLVQAAVHANSTVGFEIKKTNATTQTWRIVDGQTVNGVLEFYDATNSATRMAIKGDGKVGIGTAAPIEKLHVTGQLISTGSNSTSATAGVERAIMDLSSFSATDHSARFGHFRGTNSAGAGQLRLYTDSVERVRIDQDGQVGIGTTTPAATLHTVARAGTTGLLVAGAASNNVVYFANSSGVESFVVNADGKTKLRRSGSAGTVQIFEFGASQVGGIQVQSTGLGLAGAARENDLFIKTDGNVGIGTTAPTHKLHVAGTVKVTGTQTFDVASSGGSYIAINHSGNESWTWGAQSGSGSDDYLDVGISGGTRAMSWHENGYVGIGTTTPAAKLEVKGLNTSTSDWGNVALMSSVQINAANRTYGALTMVDHGTGDGAAIGFRYDGTGYKLELATAPSGGGALSTHLTIDRLGAITTSGHLTLAGDLIAGNVLSTHGHPNADDFIVGNISGSATGLTIVTAPGGSGNIHFGDGTSSGNANIQGQLVYAHNDNSFRFYTAVTEKMRITSTGNVGIGTDNPLFKLHVDSGATDVVGYFKSSDNKAAILITDNDTNTYVSSESSRSSIGSNPGVHANNLNIDNTGRVGIGVTSPSAILEIKDASSAAPGTALKVHSVQNSAAADGLVFIHSEQSLAPFTALNVRQDGNGDILNLLDGTDEVFTVINGGNVGIDEDTPATKLHVVGGRASGTMYDTAIFAGGQNSTSGSGARIYISGCENDPLARGTIIEGKMIDNGNSHELNFYTSANSQAPAKRLTIDNSGNAYFHGAGHTNLEVRSGSTSTKAFIQTVQDSDIRIGSSTNHPVAFYSNSVERLRIESGGNVGIGGTSSINSKLSVFADGEAFRVDGTANTSRTIRFRNTGVNGSSNAIIVSDGSLQLKNEDANAAININSIRNIEYQVTSGNATAGHHIFTSYNTEIMRIDGANNRVGIGTTSPNSKLMVIDTGNSKSQIEFSNHVTYRGSIGHNAQSGHNEYRTEAGGGMHAFFKGATSTTPEMILDNLGRLGIGTTAPSSPLHIQTNDSTTNSAVNSLMITNLSTGTTTTGFGGEIRFQAERNNGVNQNTGGIRSVAEVNSGTNISSGMAFDTSAVGVNSEKLRITFDGKVGIGTITPATKLHVSAGSTNANTIARLQQGTTAGNYSGIEVGRTDGSGNVQTTTAVFGGVPISGTAGIILGSHTTALPAVAIQSANSSSGHIVFNPKGQEKVRITADGNVGIGVTSPGQKLTVAGGVESQAGQGSVSFYSTTAGSYTQQNGASGTAWAYGATGGNSAPNTAASTTFGFHHWNGSAWSNPLNINTSGKVGIGTGAPHGMLHVAESKASGGNLWTQIGAGNAPSIHIQNTGNAANTNAVLYFRNSSAEKASIGARFVNQSTGQSELRFSVTSSGGVSRERMTLSGDGTLCIGESIVPNSDASMEIKTAAPNTGITTLRLTNAVNNKGQRIDFYDDNAAKAFTLSHDNGSNITNMGNFVNEPFAFYTNSAERMRITAAGDVSVASGGGLYFGGGTRSTATNAQAYIKENGLNLDIKGNDNVRLLGDGGNIILHADYTGKVGIGTSAPFAMFEVQGDEFFMEGGNQTKGPGIFLGNPSFGNASYYNSAPGIGAVGPYGGVSGGLGFYTYGGATNSRNEHMRIDNLGNVGIGTTAPAQRLHVQGTTSIIRVQSTSANQNASIWFNSNVAGTQANRWEIGTNISAAGDLEFFDRLNGVSRMVIEPDGNVGIATISPFSRLQSGGHTFSGSHGMHADSRVGISNHGALTGMMLASTYNDANHPEYGLVFVQGPSTSSYNVWSISPDGPAKGNGLNFHYGAQTTNIHAPGLQKVTFKGDGKVGIGTASPGAPLEVNKTSDGDVLRLTRQSVGSWNFKVSNTPTLPGVGAGALELIPTVGNSYFAVGISGGSTTLLHVKNTGLYTVDGSAASPSYSFTGDSDVGMFRPTTNTLAFGTGGAERMRVTSDGTFIIGGSSPGDFGITLDPSPSGNSLPSMELVRDFSGTATMIRFTNIGGSPYVGSITSTTSATAYNTSSDERLKENIQNAESASEKIDNIKVRQFDWKVDGSHQDYGVVAQELETVAPEAVSRVGDGTYTENNDMMGVDYSKLVPMLIKEIQELRKRVADLEE